MPRFTLRDLFWLTLVVGMACALGVNHTRRLNIERKLQTRQSELESELARMAEAHETLVAKRVDQGEEDAGRSILQIKAELSANIAQDCREALARCREIEKKMYVAACRLQAESIVAQAELAWLKRAPEKPLTTPELIGIAHRHLLDQNHARPFLASYLVRNTNDGFAVFVEHGHVLEPDGSIFDRVHDAICTVEISPEGKVTRLVP